MGVSVTACDSPLALSSPQPGKGQAGSPRQWRPDTASDSCLCCGNDFSIAPSSPLPRLGYTGRERVCTHCHALAEATLESTVSTHSLTRLESATASSETSDNEQLGGVVEELAFRAVDVLALTSRDKRSKLQYQSFVQSEAVSWLMDAGIMSSRTRCAALWQRAPDTSNGFRSSATFSSTTTRPLRAPSMPTSTPSMTM
uniref:Uncharacterized protein n=1 Tax=Phytophthora fragariae TaxID=53985 RepID=A0A6A3F9W5_9STRA|nr:hypothetical protein PF009_g8165 [Phytophthora fragariae]